MSLLIFLSAQCIPSIFWRTERLEEFEKHLAPISELLSECLLYQNVSAFNHSCAGLVLTSIDDKMASTEFKYNHLKKVEQRRMSRATILLLSLRLFENY